MKNHFAILPLILFLLFWACGDGDVAGGASEGELKTLYGTFVTEEKAPVHGAMVRLFKADNRTAIDSMKTDSEGKYSFDSLAAGVYDIEALYTDKDTLIASVEDIVYDSIYDVGEKIMRAPGAVAGVVSCDEEDLAGIDCYLEGTSYDAKTDSLGSFTISPIPAGEYTLVAEWKGTLYAKKRYGKVTVIVDSVISIDTIRLQYDTTKAPPAPKEARVAKYDATTGIATIEWDSVPVADLAGYILYGTGSDGKTEQLSSSLISKNTTLYQDSLWKRLYKESDKKYSYQLRSQDRDNNKSDLLSKMGTYTPTNGPTITEDEDTTKDTTSDGAISKAFLDSFVVHLDSLPTDNERMETLKETFLERKMRADQLTKIVNEFINTKEDVIHFAYPLKMVDSHRIYKVIAEAQKLYFPNDLMDWILSVPPAFVYDSSATVMSDEEAIAISTAMDAMQPSDNEVLKICKIGIKYQHISQAQLDGFLSQVSYSSSKTSLTAYGKERLIQ